MTEKTSKAEKRALELRQLRAEAEKAEIELETERLSLAARKRDYDYAYATSSDELGVFYFSSPVDDATAAALASKVRKYAHLHDGAPITIVINTPGGRVLPGLALYDELRSLSAQGHHITIQVRGYAASFGAILLQAGDTRLVGPEAYLMVHELSAGVGGKMHEMRDEVEFYERMNRRLFAIMAERSGGKFNARTLYAKAKAKDLWINAKDAVETYGLADAIG